jgi:hypothetical protein
MFPTGYLRDSNQIFFTLNLRQSKQLFFTLNLLTRLAVFRLSADRICPRHGVTPQVDRKYFFSY